MMRLISFMEAMDKGDFKTLVRSPAHHGHEIQVDTKATKLSAESDSVIINASLYSDQSATGQPAHQSICMNQQDTPPSLPG